METKKAIALRYKPDEDNAPKVIAMGKGEIAEKILSIAAQNGVPVVVKPQLADQLIKLELNHEIPEELYTVVAQILAYIYKLEDRLNNK
ncbi:MAG: hypothetical protein GXW85_06710 [Clostridia bacterium]|nr:hypothetical protein [Clostridia bacterium]